MTGHLQDAKGKHNANFQRARHEDLSSSHPDSSEISGHFSDLEDNSDAGILSNSSSSNPSNYGSSETLSTTEDSWSVIVGDEGNSETEDNQDTSTQTFGNGDISTMSSNGEFHRLKPSSDDLLETPKGSIQTLKGESISSSSYIDKITVLSTNHERIDVTQYTCAAEPRLCSWEFAGQKSEYYVDYFLKRLLYIRRYMKTHRAVSLSMAIFLLSCVVGRVVYMFDDYLWRNSIVNKSLPLNYIATHSNYKALYEEVCEDTQQKLHNELTHCISDFFTTHPQSGNCYDCFDKYEQGLKKDAEFCKFDVDKMLRNEVWDYYGTSFRQSRELLQIVTSRVLKGFVSWSVNITETFGGKTANSYNKARELVQKEGLKGVTFFYRRGHEFQAHLIDHCSKLYNSSKSGTLKIYKGRIAPMVKAGISECTQIYRNRLVPLGKDARRIYVQKVIPTAKGTFFRIRSFPYQKHAEELRREILSLNKSINGFVVKKMSDIQKVFNRILATV